MAVPSDLGLVAAYLPRLPIRTVADPASPLFLRSDLWTLETHHAAVCKAHHATRRLWHARGKGVLFLNGIYGVGAPPWHSEWFSLQAVAGGSAGSVDDPASERWRASVVRALGEYDPDREGLVCMVSQNSLGTYAFPLLDDGTSKLQFPGPVLAR